MEYRAVFKCIAGCDAEYDLEQPLYRCPKCGDLLEVVHDLKALGGRSAERVETDVRRPLQADGMALRLGRVGQERMGLPRRPRREHRVDGRGRHQPDVGRAIRARARHGRALDQDVRAVAHGILQGSRHDGARLGRPADDRRQEARSRRRVRLHRRHVGIARRVCRRRRDSFDRHPAAWQGVDRPARAAARERRARAVARHRLRRLHGHRAAALGRGGRVPRELDEQPASGRTEDGRHRDRAAVRLVGARTSSSFPAAILETSARSARAST